jgi:hypothetical protein
MFPTAARQTTVIFIASCFCIFIFFWIGSIFVSTPQADIVALRLPFWDEAKWWVGRPDTAFYIEIAEHGYQAGPYSPAVRADWAFFPAYPFLLRLLVHGRSAETYLMAGFLLSVLFYGLSVFYLRRLLLFDFDEDTVIRAILLLCFYPFAFSLAIFGPDSLCLLTVCAAFYHARHGRWAFAWNNAPSWPFAFLVPLLREPVLIGHSGWDPIPLSLIATFAMLAVLVWCVRTRSIPMEYCLFLAFNWLC